jgi:hypothetical protein
MTAPKIVMPSQIVMRATASLIGYARNSRTHSPERVRQLADNIERFGWTQPVLIDGNRGVIAGHGRLMAAELLGLVEVPCIEWGDVSRSMRRVGVKDAICEDCGCEHTVRKDTHPKVCRRCTSARGGKGNIGIIRSERVPCKTCGASLRVSSGDTYCNAACRRADKYIGRTCKKCDKEFSILLSSIGRTTNASGNFCSRPCYDKWLCNTERTTGRGSRWSAIRREVLRMMPYCAVCGTRKGLEVHHIVPYRLTRDNDIKNLVPLCHRDHKKIECLTVEVENCGVSVDFMGEMLRWRIRQRQVMTAQVLRRIWNATHQLRPTQRDCQVAAQSEGPRPSIH